MMLEKLVILLLVPVCLYTREAYITSYVYLVLINLTNLGVFNVSWCSQALDFVV